LTRRTTADGDFLQGRAPAAKVRVPADYEKVTKHSPGVKFDPDCVKRNAKRRRQCALLDLYTSEIIFPKEKTRRSLNCKHT
jgi:hypothetical protein